MVIEKITRVQQEKRQAEDNMIKETNRVLAESKAYAAAQQARVEEMLAQKPKVVEQASIPKEVATAPVAPVITDEGNPIVTVSELSFLKPRKKLDLTITDSVVKLSANNKTDQIVPLYKIQRALCLPTTSTKQKKQWAIVLFYTAEPQTPKKKKVRATTDLFCNEFSRRHPTKMP
jgi:hypothetical protein